MEKMKYKPSNLIPYFIRRLKEFFFLIVLLNFYRYTDCQDYLSRSSNNFLEGGNKYVFIETNYDSTRPGFPLKQVVKKFNIPEDIEEDFYRTVDMENYLMNGYFFLAAKNDTVLFFHSFQDGSRDKVEIYSHNIIKNTFDKIIKIPFNIRFYPYYYNADSDLMVCFSNKELFFVNLNLKEIKRIELKSIIREIEFSFIDCIDVSFQKNNIISFTYKDIDTSKFLSPTIYRLYVIDLENEKVMNQYSYSDSKVKSICSKLYNNNLISFVNYKDSSTIAYVRDIINEEIIYTKDFGENIIPIDFDVYGKKENEVFVLLTYDSRNDEIMFGKPLEDYKVDVNISIRKQNLLLINLRW